MSAREVYDGNSLYRIKGLDERADLIEAAADGLSESLAGTVAAARTALGDWTGPLAVSFAAQFNTVASRIVTLHLTARAAAATCRNFPDAVPSSRIAADYEYMGARVDAATSTAVSADPATMTTAGGKLAALRSLCTAVDAAVTTSGITATVSVLRDRTPAEKQRLIDQGVAPGVVNAEPQTWGDPEPIAIGELVKLPELSAEAGTAGSEADELGSWTNAISLAVLSADKAILELLLKHPELARYLDGKPWEDGHMSGEGALLVILAHLKKLDTLAGGAQDGKVDLADLQRAAADGDSSELLRGAAQYLLDNRLFLSQASLDDQTAWETAPAAAGLDAAGIERFLAFNAAIRTVASDFEQLDAAGGDGDGTVSKADLEAAANGTGVSGELQSAAQFLLANEALARRLSLYGAANMSRNMTGGMGGPATLSGSEPVEFERHDVWVIAIDQQAFAGDHSAARGFVLDLPMADRNGDGGIPIELMSDEGVKALANAALLDTHGDLSDAHAVIAHLPETTSWAGPRGAVEQRGGVRNQLINGFYDLMAGRADAILAGPELAGHPDMAGHPGANWLKFAPWASDTVGAVIRGEIRPFGMLPPVVPQAAADGNQWIFNDIGQRFTAFIELYEDSPNPSEAQLEHFFRANFADGDGTIRDGFAAYVASMDETDPVARQRLVYQGNVEVAIHEQAGAQVYLERANWGPDGIAAFFVDAQVGDQHLDLNVDLPQRAGANNLIWDEPILSMDVGGKTAADFSAGDSRFAVGVSPSPTIGVVDVDPIAGTEMYRPDFSPSSKVWFERGGPLQYVQDPYGQQYQLPTDPEALDGTGAATWPDWNQRMNSISRMFEQYHTDTTLYDTSEIGVSLHGISWLDSSSIPR